MKKRIGIAITTAALAILGLAAPAFAAWGATSWGSAWSVDYNNGRWYGTVDDTLTDGYCVELWTINDNGAKVSRIARSCGAPKSGSVWGGGAEDVYGIRMFRDNGNYLTIVWP